MIIITGDSHITALAKALKELGADKRRYIAHALGNGAFFNEPFFKLTAKQKVILTHEQFIKFNHSFLQGWPTFNDNENGQKQVCLSLGFYSAHLTKDVDWKRHYIVSGVRTELDEVPITRGMLATMVHHQLQYIHRFYEAIMLQGIQLSVVVAPPPLRRLMAIQRGVSPERLREIDDCFLEIAHRKCGELGVPVIPRPEKFTDELGFLREEYAREKKNDRLHAGPVYAREQAKLVMQHYDLEALQSSSAQR